MKEDPAPPRTAMEEGMENKDPAARISRMPLPKSPSCQYAEAHTEEDRFHIALRELKDLRSQLHDAADYCEAAFLKAGQKKIVMESTKSYLCDAVVTVIDHLGNVSSKLEHGLSGNSEIARTEQRINLMRQRLLTCQQYAISLELSTLKWSAKLPRHHHHYVSPLVQSHQQSTGAIRDEATDAIPSDTPSEKDQRAVVGPQVSEAGGIINPRAQLNSGVELATVPILGGVIKSSRTCELARAVPVLDKPRKSSFASKPEDVHTLEVGDQKNKPAGRNNILSFFQMTKKKALKSVSRK